MRGTASRARSRSGSKATTVAERWAPSSRMTVVDGSPATTWALVTTSPGLTTKPEPSSTRWHDTPSTFTTDRATWASWAADNPVPAGGATWPADGSRSSTTPGNWLGPTSVCTILAASGAVGRSVAKARATRE